MSENDWPMVKLGEVCEINSRKPSLRAPDDQPVTFIPMAGVAENAAGVVSAEQRPFSQVKKGYRYFETNDVIFAKITPCMQNGKHAIVNETLTGFGFGSTEFHVIRASESITPEWVHYFITQPRVLQEAKKHFYGAVGQQRIPADYLENLTLPLPPLPEQRAIARRLTAQMEQVATARAAAQARLDAALALPFAVVEQTLQEDQVETVDLGSALEHLSHGVGERWSEYRLVGATRDGVAKAKVGVGKNPERYKPVDDETVFYNPMRILEQSIGMLPTGEKPAITSPDYVVVKGRRGVLCSRWFYYWLRSPRGRHFIKSHVQGAVRPRLKWNTLAEASVPLPNWTAQQDAEEALQRNDAIVEAAEAQLAEIDAMPAALLREVFDD